MEDSLLVIEWKKGLQPIENIWLREIFDDIMNKKLTADSTVMHAYRERNVIAGGLSKARITMAPGSSHIWEDMNGIMIEHDPGPFI